MTTTSKVVTRRARGRSGFTLVEILVALALFMGLLAVIFVPLNLAINFTSIGRARVEVRQAAQVTVDQIAADLQRAVYVYPNDALPGVTDTSPYSANVNSIDNKSYPYYETDNPNWSVCSVAAATRAAGNTARIDMLLPRITYGFLNANLPAENYILTYYARRIDTTTGYDAGVNPVVLYRAQMPYRYFVIGGGTSTLQDFRPGGAGTPLNVNYTDSRYTPACGSAATTNRELQWLTQNQYGEPNLEAMCLDADETPPNPASPATIASHTVITPKDVELPLMEDSALSLVPQMSFLCRDENGDGKIDFVRITLTVARIDDAVAAVRNGIPQPQSARLIREITLPNIAG